MSLYPATNLHEHYSNRLVTGPTVEPITVTYVKEQTRLTFVEDDYYLHALIKDARQYVENATGLAFNTQTWRLTLDDWPMANSRWWDGVRQGTRAEMYAGRGVGEVRIPRYPLQSISTITTYDEADVSTAVTVNSVFYTDVSSYAGRLRLRSGEVWPTATRLTNAIEIVYVAGFGATAADVPITCKRALALVVSYLYQHRGDGCSPSAAYMESGAAELLSEYVQARL